VKELDILRKPLLLVHTVDVRGLALNLLDLPALPLLPNALVDARTPVLLSWHDLRSRRGRNVAVPRTSLPAGHDAFPDRLRVRMVIIHGVLQAASCQ
jgi:hypothetical protein